MALPCCSLSYVKYIEEDGKTIDKVILYHERFVRMLPVNMPICMCMCHVKGCEVLH